MLGNWPWRTPRIWLPRSILHRLLGRQVIATLLKILSLPVQTRNHLHSSLSHSGRCIEFQETLVDKLSRLYVKGMWMKNHGQLGNLPQCHPAGSAQRNWSNMYWLQKHLKIHSQTPLWIYRKVSLTGLARIPLSSHPNNKNTHHQGKPARITVILKTQAIKRRLSGKEANEALLGKSSEGLFRRKVEDSAPKSGPSSRVVADTQYPGAPGLPERCGTTIKRSSSHYEQSTPPEHLPEGGPPVVRATDIWALPESRDGISSPLRRNSLVGFFEIEVKLQSPAAVDDEREISPLRRNPPFEAMSSVFAPHVVQEEDHSCSMFCIHCQATLLLLVYDIAEHLKWTAAGSLLGLCYACYCSKGVGEEGPAAAYS